MTPLRGALVLLLVGSATLFFVGSTIERSHRHRESAAARPAEVSSESGGETGHEGAKPTEKHAEAGSGEVGATILGVKTESLALSIVAVVLSLLLAAAVWLGKWRGLVLLAVFGFGLVFAAGDGREVVHQVDESNGGLAAVAAILIALHVGVASVAALLLGPRPLAAARVGQPT